jgi:Muramidase (flagellum-specific)
MPQVEKVKTEVSVSELVYSFARAWQSLLGRKPSKEQLAMFIAQNSLETGNRKSMYNYNIGNIIKGNTNFDYFLGNDTQAGKPIIQKFRSYQTLDDGVLDYLKLLYRGYPQSFAAASGGDPKEYSHSLIADPKHQYYDPTVEKNYSSGMTARYNQYMKSPEFNQAYNSAVGGVGEAPAILTKKDDKEENIFSKFLSKFKGREGELYKDLDKPIAKAPVSPPPPQQVIMKTPAPSNETFNDVINKYLQQVAASEKSNYKLYKKFLPNNHIVIQVTADNYTNAVEFSRVLCSVLDTELMSRSFVHTDGNTIEVECNIPGPEKDCFNAVQEMTQSAAEAFQIATKKIGGVEVKNTFFMNKKSSYEQIEPNFATNQYRKFLLKFI